MGNCAQVNVFQLAAHRHAARQPRQLQPATGRQGLTDDVRRGLALGCKVGREDDLLHGAVGGAVKQLFEANVLGANAIQRTELADEHEVQAFVGTRALHCGLIGRRFNNAQLGDVAPNVHAGGANSAFREGVAPLTMPHGTNRLRQCVCQCLGTGPVVLKQMERHTRSRLYAHARQALECLDKHVQRIGISHWNQLRE